jgi:hypothetical protein
MATADSTDTRRAENAASRLASAEFVSLRYRADGDALAAAGLFAGALAAIDTPFQATARRPTSAENTDRTATEADLVVSIGLPDPTDDSDGTGGTDGAADRSGDGTAIALPGSSEPASLAAAGVVRELGGEVDPVLALAGSIVAAVRDARDPFGDGPFADDREVLVDRAHERGLVGERRSGIAMPTTDTLDGLTHTTLAHAPFSGDPDAARERCGSLADREDAGREVASLLALSTVGAKGSAPRAAVAIERALRPVALPEPTGPFVTLGGYADVLGGVAAERPGIGLALALGYDVREAALSAWRTHARGAHAALRTATTARYDGLHVARLEAVETPEVANGIGTESDGNGDESGNGSFDTDGETHDGTGAPVATVARLCRDFRSPEPVALVVGDGVGAVAATDDRALGSLVANAARSVDGTGGGTERAAEARFGGDPDAFVTAVRAELADGGSTDGGTGERNRDGTRDDGGGRP